MYFERNYVCNSKLKQLHTSFLHGIKLSGYRMGIRFVKDTLAVEQNNYTTKIVNGYIYCLWFRYWAKKSY